MPPYPRRVRGADGQQNVESLTRHPQNYALHAVAAKYGALYAAACAVPACPLAATRRSAAASAPSIPVTLAASPAEPAVPHH